MGDVAAIITALGGMFSVTVGSVAIFMRQRSQSGRPAELLRRLWNWLEDQGLVDGRLEVGPIPPSITRDVKAELGIKGEASDDSPDT